MLKNLHTQTNIKIHLIPIFGTTFVKKNLPIFNIYKMACLLIYIHKQILKFILNQGSKGIRQINVHS